MLPFSFASPETLKEKKTETPPAIPFEVLIATAEVERSAGKSIKDHYKSVIENTHDDDAKEFVNALVFLATRSREKPSDTAKTFKEFPPVPSE